MGLDQYAYAFKGQLPSTATDFDEIDGAEEIFYWRKHANLEGWMSSLYYKKGGKYLFDGTRLLLTKEDLEALETAVLPETTGFFFGTTTPEKLKMDKEFIRIALKKISEGYHIYYISSW